jgi:hypothetical protein
MRTLFYKFFALSFALALFACDSEQAGQDAAAVRSTADYPTPTFTFDGATTVNEGDETVLTYTITFDKPIDRPVDFVLVQTGGDATLHEDFDFVNTSVPAYATTAEAKIKIYNDDLIEGSETLTFEIQRGSSLANKYLINPDTTFPAAITITIENYESPDLSIILDWSGSYIGDDGADHDLCDLDLDIEIYTEDWEIVANSYSDCPESVTFSPGDLEDGLYHIVPSFWSNSAAAASLEDFNIPASLMFLQPGAQSETFDLNDVWSFNAGGYADGNTEGAYYYNYQLEVAGDNFIITDSEGNVVFQQ